MQLGSNHLKLKGGVDDSPEIFLLERLYDKLKSGLCDRQ